jgi:hypothetical protein
MRGRAPAMTLLLALLASTSCIACSHPPEAAGRSRSPTSGGPASPREPSEPPPGPVVPVPETLALVAGQFGLTMQAEGFTWKVLRRNVTRFDWSGRPASGDRELLYSFYMEKLDETSAKLLPQIVGAAAANLTEGEPCRPFEQPAEIVQKLGVDRVVTVCFEPSTFYGKEHRHAVLHGIVHDGALTIVAVLSNESTAIIPLPKIIGAQGKR